MKRLLFIDDDSDFLKSNEIYFVKKGYEVLCAERAADAFRYISSASIDCVILDIDMPDMNGFDFAVNSGN